MLKKSRAAGAPPVQPAPIQRHVTYNRWCGDHEAAAARSALECGDALPLVTAYSSPLPARREFLVGVTTMNLPPVPYLESWPDLQPESAVAWLMRGGQRISSAWRARGVGPARSVSPDAWSAFFEQLRAAESDLMRSISIVDDGVAWSMALASGRGLQLTTDELHARYRRAIAASPDLPSAAERLMVGVSAKWSGSHEEMFAVARRASADAPDGDPRHRLIALAHIERAIAQEGEALQRYREDPAVQREIEVAALRSVSKPHYGSTPYHVIALNYFAFALSYFHAPDRARPLLERVGGAITDMPWSYFKNPLGLLDKYRAEAGLPRLLA